MVRYACVYGKKLQYLCAAGPSTVSQPGERALQNLENTATTCPGFSQDGALFSHSRDALPPLPCRAMLPTVEASLSEETR